MHIVVMKLIEVLTRAGFVVGVSYTLPLAMAGQFGIIVTLIGLFAFGIGYERHLDIQRRTAGAGPELLDRTLSAAVPLYGFNFLVLAPIFVLVVVEFSGIGAGSVLLCVVILVCELISNQIYQISIIDHRYICLMAIVCAKNISIIIFIAIQIIFDINKINLDYVIMVWALTSVIYVASALVLWVLFKRRVEYSDSRGLFYKLRDQYLASFVHFKIGLLGILSLQFDRIVVGGLLSMHDVGIYFRNVLIISFVYQLFNVASFNRVLPRVFAYAKSHSKAEARNLLLKEFLKIFALATIVFLTVWAVDVLTQHNFSSGYGIVVPLVAILLLGSLFRIAADFSGLILHSRMRESTVLRQQLIAFSMGWALLIVLTWRFGIYGTATAGLVTSTLYFLLNARAVRLLPERPVS